jgi:hypothetical protein
MNQSDTIHRAGQGAGDVPAGWSSAGRFRAASVVPLLALALLIGVVEASLGPSVAPWQAQARADWRHYQPGPIGAGDFLLLTLTASVAFVAWAIGLDGRATRLGWDAGRRFCLVLPAFGSVLAVLFWANLLAERARIGDTAALTIVVILPTLIVTSALCWRSALALERELWRRLLLGGYVLAVALLESALRTATGDRFDERGFTFNSMLIGLAVLVRLLVWSAVDASAQPTEVA